MKEDTSNSEIKREIGRTLPKSAIKSLSDLRHNIDTIDRQIMELLAKRQTEVEKMVSLKKAYHLPVHHPAREEDMISDRRQQGQDVGLDSDYMEKLYRTIFRQSRIEQIESIARKGIRPGATVLVVGGTRCIGKYLCQWFNKAGYETRSMGSKHWSDIDILCDGFGHPQNCPSFVSELHLNRPNEH